MDDWLTPAPPPLFGIVNDSDKVGFAMSCEARVGSLLATLAASKPGGRILELGTGTGAGAAWAPRRDDRRRAADQRGR